MKDKPKNKKPIFLFIGKDKEPLFSKKNKKLLSDPLDDNNPIKNYFEKVNLLSYQSSSVIRSFGSSALNFAWLASGKIDCLFINKLSKNQIACGELLIKEAGGYLTNLKYISAYDTKSNLLIGANPILHKEILKKMNYKD